MADYMVADPNTGGAKIWWNFGPDNTWANGWRWYGEGAQVANGIPHANLKTLRFADRNGDGRADYVYIGEGGSLRLFLNIGTVGGQDVLWLDQGGIATGAAPDISKLVFADVSFSGLFEVHMEKDGPLTHLLYGSTATAVTVSSSSRSLYLALLILI